MSFDRVAYQRAYRVEHREKARAYQRAYHAEHRAEIRANKYAWEALNAEKVKAYGEAWREANREAIRTRGRVRSTDPSVRRQHAEYARAYGNAHPDRVAAHARRRREAPWVYVRIDPWPLDCAICGGAIDQAQRWPQPFSASVGHEPPLAWMRAHPDHDGPLLLRPEHLRCNISKAARRDEEGGA